MKGRKKFDSGPNEPEHHLQSLFQAISATGNGALAADISRALATGAVKNAALVESLRARPVAGEVIPGQLSSGHHHVPFANFRRADIDGTLASMGSSDAGDKANANAGGNASVANGASVVPLPAAARSGAPAEVAHGR
jgi:hypothetical protein